MKIILFQKINNIIRVFWELKVAVRVFLVMLLPVTFFTIFFEFFLDKKNIYTSIIRLEMLRNDFQLQNFNVYILYLTASMTHLIVSTIVIYRLREKLLVNGILEKKKILNRVTFLFTILFIILFIFLDNLNLNIGLLSHERVYAILKNSDDLFFLFKHFPSKYYEFKFYLFSIIPSTSIFLGLIVIVFTCLNIGKDIKSFLFSIENNEYKDINGRKLLLDKVKNFHHYLYLLSAVLVTSTIATIIFFELPLPYLLKDSIGYQIFSQSSIAMGITWGVIFSLTMLFMYFYPLIIVHKTIKRVQKENLIINNREIVEWTNKIEDNYIIYKDLKSSLSVLLPSIIGIIPQFL